jgi:DNA repair protein RadC
MDYTTALVQLPLVCDSPRQHLKTPEDVYRVCCDIAGLAQEAFHVLSIDAKNRLINRHLVSLGLVDASLVHPREVYRQVIPIGASAVVLVHNHPSGDPTPSAEDLRITRQLVEAGRIIDIKVLDHVIVGRPGPDGQPAFLSMRESGLVAFA